MNKDLAQLMEGALRTVRKIVLAWLEGHCVKTNAFAFCCNKACLRWSGNQSKTVYTLRVQSQPRRSSPAPSKHLDLYCVS